MKAIVAKDFAPLDQLEYADWPEPEATGSDVVIKAETIGVNYPDGLLVQGLYQMKPPLPFVPGMEVAGTVIAVGEKVKKFAVGDRVAAMLMTGTYAEKVAAPETAAMKLPDGMDGADDCALMCAYGTSHHALKQRARLQPGETLCVLGAAGATGIAVASSGEKLEIARDAGAGAAIGYENLKETLKEATNGRGVDVAFDPVGGDAFDALSRAMAWNGRLLVIGFASGTIPKFPVNLALVKGFGVVGVFWGSFTQREPETCAENMKELIDWYMRGRIRPVIEGRYPLADAANVLERILGRGATGKLVLEP